MKKEIRIKTEEELQQPILGWQRIEELIKEKSVASYVLALIEAEKLLNQALSKKGFPGKTLEEKISYASEKFSNLPKLNYARDLRKNVVEKINFNTNTLDLEEAIRAYRQAIIDLDLEAKPLSFIERLFLTLEYNFPSKLKIWRKWFLAVLGFFAAIWFLANTSVGQAIAQFFVNLTNLIFSWALAIILLVVGVIIVIVGTIFYFEKKRRK